MNIIYYLKTKLCPCTNAIPHSLSTLENIKMDAFIRLFATPTTTSTTSTTASTTTTSTITVRAQPDTALTKEAYKEKVEKLLAYCKQILGNQHEIKYENRFERFDFKTQTGSGSLTTIRVRIMPAEVGLITSQEDFKDFLANLKAFVGEANKGIISKAYVNKADSKEYYFFDLDLEVLKKLDMSEVEASWKSKIDNKISCEDDGNSSLFNQRNELDPTKNLISNNTSPTTLSITHNENHDITRQICSWLPLQPLSRYARTCSSTFQFVMQDQTLWQVFASVQKIQLISPIPPKHPALQVKNSMALMALEKAKDFDAEFLKTANHRFPNRSAYENAVKYYIEAARRGNIAAKEWLMSAASADKFTLNGQIWNVLGDIYSNENASQKLIDSCYEKAWTILFDNATAGDPNAIQRLYDKPLGKKPVGEINQILDKLLLEQIKTVSSQGSKATSATEWILNVFSSPELPASYKAKKEQALLAVLKSVEFKGSSHSVWSIFRYEHHEYDQVRDLIEAKLNKVLGTQDNPIKFHFEATSHNHNVFLIRTYDKNDTTRFANAIKKSAFASLFSPLTELSPGFSALTFKDSLRLTIQSWNQFKEVLATI